MNQLLRYCLLLGLIACTPSNQSNTTNNTTYTDTVETITAAKNLETQTEAVSDFRFPTDSTYPTNVLPTGNFHEDEVWPQADQENWIGLFKNNDSIYLSSTTISLAKVHDPVLDDDENIKTGWEVKTSINDTAILLFTNKDSVTKRNIRPAALAKDHVYPGESIRFTYLGTQYTLYATGQMKKIPGSEEYPEITNYRLYLKAVKEGKEIKQLLVAQPDFSDAFITILFAGDIDNDGKIDLIIDTSYHYNAEAPTLYLSKPADNNNLLQVAGQHVRVGC